MATKKDTPKKEAKPKKEPKYKIELEFNGEVVKLEGDEVFATLQTFPEPDFIKTDVVTRVYAGKEMSEVVLNVQKARRIFANKTSLELHASNLSKRLNG